MAHGGGEEFIMLIAVYLCALIVCIVPGDLMFCFGRKNPNLALEITGIVFLSIGAVITMLMGGVMLKETCRGNNTSYTDSDKSTSLQCTLGIGIPILLIGLIPGIGCGLGYHVIR